VVLKIQIKKIAWGSVNSNVDFSNFKPLTSLQPVLPCQGQLGLPHLKLFSNF